MLSYLLAALESEEDRVIRRAILTVMTESLGIWRMIKDLLHILKWKN